MRSNLRVPTFGFWSAGQKAGGALNTSARSRIRAAMPQSGGNQCTAAANIGAPLNLSVQDWDALFCAIQERLRQIVGERNTGSACLQMHETSGSIQDGVLECVAALDQLHAALACEREQENARGKLVESQSNG